MSKVKNWRRRADDEEEEEPAVVQQQQPQPKSKREVTKLAVKPSSGPKLLSFVEDEDDGQDAAGRKKEPKEKRSSSSSSSLKQRHKIELGKGKEKLKSASNVQAQVGEYTKEKLLELQRNTKTLGATANLAPADTVSAGEPVVLLKGLLKPAVVEEPTAAVRSFVEEEGVRKVEATTDAEKRLGLMGIGTGADSGGVTHIPDAAMIAAAKARRNRLRQAQAAPDYISVTNDGDHVRSNPSEVGKEDDADSSEDEAELHGRMSFLGDTKPRGSRGAVIEAITKEDDDDDEADEERSWEEEQLRKGFGKRVEDVSLVVPGAVPVLPAKNAGNFGYAYGRGPEEGMSFSLQVEGSWKSLQENISKMRESHRRTKSELHRTEEILTSSLSGVASLEQALGSASEKYLYMQELRSYFAILCDFLQVKGPFIEELEDAMQRLREDRANALLERRAADNADEMAEIEVAISAAKAALAKGGGTAAAAKAATAVRDSVRNSTVPQLDEFGRDLNLQKLMESRRRAQARERRAKLAADRRLKALKFSNGDSARTVMLEGESSSEESESEEKAFRSHKQEVLMTAESVYGDAAEEYSQLAKVKEKLESWKRQYSGAYSDAYMQLSTPSIFAPYVRLELLHWDPLHGSAGFDSMNWYNLLFDFGVQQENHVQHSMQDEDDADVNLIPKLVEKVALPALHHELEHCWDVLSTKGTKRAVKAVQETLIYVDAANSEPLQEMLVAVHKRMLNAVATLEVPAWSHQVTAAVPGSMRFVNRQFGVAVRLLRNLGFWKDVLALPQLEKLALDYLLSGKILVYLRVGVTTEQDAITRLERIVAALTGVWVGPSFTELSPKLATLIEYMLEITRSLEKKRETEFNQFNEATVALARRMKRLLVDVNEYDRARSLNKVFQLKEAL